MAGCVFEKLSHCTISKHDAVEYRRTEDARQQQYAEALLWCAMEEKQLYVAECRRQQVMAADKPIWTAATN